MEKPNKKLRLGVAGYCPPSKFDEQKALDYIKEAYDKVEKDFPNYQITVVSGLTNVGVLKLAYEEAKRRGWKTGAVTSKKALEQYADNLFPIDEEPVIIGKNWGDESPTFVNSIDAMVRIGLGPQSLREAKQIKEAGKPAYEYDLPKLENGK
jgi:hypothetical protein